VTAGFAGSYAFLCVVQGATVALPGRPRALTRFRSRWWALLPLASIVLVIVAIRAASGVADGLTYLALATTPALAAATLGWTGRRRHPLAALLVVPLFALAWADRGGVPGEAAAVTLTALGCATLGVLLAALSPTRWLKLGVIAMSVADTVLVVVDLLQSPNQRLNAAHPALGLPQFQRAAFADAVMGYGDIFLAAVLGAILVFEHRRRDPIALLTSALALAFGLLFFFVNELPATVPVAVALVVAELRDRRSRARPPAPALRGGAPP
jgi:hypothetical protein